MNSELELIWKEEFSAGDATIDQQHRALFAFVNGLEQKVGKQPNAAEIGRYLKILGNYIKSHFAYEENCMARYRCPVAARNKKAHHTFLEQFQGFKDRFKRGENLDLLLFDLHQTSASWLKSHICGVDIHLRKSVLGPEFVKQG